MPAEVPVEVLLPIKAADEPVVLQLKQVPIVAIQPTGGEVQLAEVVTPPPAPTEVAMAVLPHTASWLPLIALFGPFALAGAWVLRLAQKRLV
jgi:hypothetical protein